MRWKAIKTRRDMLQELQGLLATIYDVPLVHDVTDFLLTDRRHLPAAFQSTPADEQVLVTEDGSTLWLGVFLEAALLERLASENPLEALHGGNIADYWTALEGVSHFVYLVWNAGHDRPVTLLELELQGEIDKYVTSLWLLGEQDPERFPIELHHVLFTLARVDVGLAGERAGLYRHANAYAARFCRRLARLLGQKGPPAYAAALSELRQFYRLPRALKLRYIERMA